MTPVKPTPQDTKDVLESSGTQSEVDKEQYFAAFGHPIRRRIILLCGERQRIGFSDIKRETQASTGSIYHHLEAMAECLTQNDQKKYELTSFGQKVFHFLNQPDDSMVKKQESPLIERIRSIIRKSLVIFPFPHKEEHFMGNRKYTWLLSHVILVILAMLSAIFNLQAYLFYYASGTPIWDSWFTSIWISRIFTFLSVFVGYYFIVFILEGIFHFLYAQTNHPWQLWRKLGFVYLPLIIYAFILGLFKLIAFDSILFGGILKIMAIFFQIWALFLLAEIVSNEKKIEFEQALIIALFVQYGTLIILLLANIS